MKYDKKFAKMVFDVSESVEDALYKKYTKQNEIKQRREEIREDLFASSSDDEDSIPVASAGPKKGPKKNAVSFRKSIKKAVASVKSKKKASKKGNLKKDDDDDYSTPVRRSNKKKRVVFESDESDESEGYYSVGGESDSDSIETVYDETRRTSKYPLRKRKRANKF